MHRRRGHRMVWMALLILFLGLGGSGFAAGGIAEKASDHLAGLEKAGTFSGSVLIAQKGEVLLRQGYGLANREHNVPNTPRTKFRLGSVTKQFTAMAVMILQEQGQWKVEDPIGKYLPGFPNGNKITLHHLLTHTAGVPSFTGFADYISTMMIPSPPDRTVEKFKNLPLEFEPGGKFAYSNSGYVLLGHLIETVAVESYEDVLKEKIFQPLGMADTGYDHSETILENRAAGYAKTGSRLANCSHIDMSIPHAAGALYSTVEDLYAWDRALYTETLLPKESMAKVFTPFKEHYAYGWFVDEKDGHERVSHGGGINGFSTGILRYPKDDVCVVVLSNFEFSNAVKIAEELAAIVFEEGGVE